MAKERGVQMGIIYGIEDLPQRNENYKVIITDIVEETDICIMGSGAAGAVLAKELVESGKRVVLLEKGGYYEGKDMNQREADMMPLLWKNAGFNFNDSLRIAIAQGCCLGGSTIINDAVCFDTPPRVREEWSNKYGVDFSNDEWTNHLKRVNETLHVTEVEDNELNRNNMMLREGARKLGLRDHRKNSRNCVNCMQCGFCHIGCHYETKQNVLVTYIHQALKNPDSQIRIYCNCNVSKIVYRNGRVEGVDGDFVDIDGNKKYRIRVNAKVFIISAGAIASSKLLLTNGIAQDTAGKGLCLHPGIQVLGDFDYEIKGNEGIPMAYTVHDFGVDRKTDETRKEYNFDSGGEFLIESIFIPLFQFSIALSASSIIEHRKLIERFNNYAMAGIVVRDGNIGKVSLTATGRASVTYEAGENELKVLAKGVEVLGKMWFRLGARRIIIPHRNLSIIDREDDIPKLIDKILHDPKNLLLGSAHPQSGNRIGADAVDSVVDSNCRVHGLGNLFVCDASVFPTAVGVNPQISVMTIASIIASRIRRDWDAQYGPLNLGKQLDKVCEISQPMYCLRDNLSQMFDSVDTQFGAQTLINSVNDKADESNWKFDAETLMITNNSHWKGIFPRDIDLRNTLTLYFGGFWKRFSDSEKPTISSTSVSSLSSDITGITHPFEVPLFAVNTALDTKLDGFGRVVLLKYRDPPYNMFYDVLKIVDENTVLGKAFFTNPQPGREILTFSMSRRYPLEYMTEEDHEMLYSKMKKPSMESMIGIWEGQLVSDSTWTDPVFRFRIYFENNTTGRILKNDYLFNKTLAGTATVEEKEDHLEMHDETKIFHDELRQIDDNMVIGKYYSETKFALGWLPSEGLSFLHLDTQRSTIYLPYILKKIGNESIFRNRFG
jgi:choline dehydrogenase-like flavoprotein